MLRSSLDTLPASRMREVANAAIGRDDLVKFWFGEGDLATPEFIRAAAKASLDEGETFYNHNLGLLELRESIAGYLNRLHQPQHAIGSDRLAVTSAGVNALALAAQALFEPGDRVAIVTPVWPNVTAQPAILGAQVIRVPLDNRNGRWTLDLDRLLDIASPGTRAVIVNSPGNPTGWVMPQPQWQALLAHCRRHGIWLIADDAYERLCFDTDPAPGVTRDIDPDEHFISANTFSKTWTMTGWRLGWLLAPRGFIAGFAKMVEFNTSCAPMFVQRAGMAAIAHGDELIALTRARLLANRNRLTQQLAALPGVECAPPDGAMYQFFRIAGRSDDSLAFCKQLVRDAGLGLAPGVAFGPEGEGWVRWCFAAQASLIDDGVARLARFLAGGRGAG
jgi:aspartate/methionine/tyrosine aminotransferase